MVIVSDRTVPMASTFGNTYFKPSAFGSQSGGSRVAGYAKTAVEVVEGGMNLWEQLQSISAMPVYKDKTPEELRWEDYKSGDKGGIGFGGWATQPNFFTASRLSAKPASNPFSSSTSANIFAPRTRASASEGFGPSNSPAFSSFSPSGHSSSNPFSSDVGASIAPAPCSSPFQASACPFRTTSLSTPFASGKASASLFGANSSEPSLGTSSLPTFEPTPSVFSSSSSSCANCRGTSTQPIFGANNSSGCFLGEPTSSISSNLGVPPNFVSHSLFGQTTAQVPVYQSIAPSFGINLLSQGYSSTPGRCCCVCPSNMSNTAFTGNGSAGNLLSSTRLAFPPNTYGVGQATTSSFPFHPMQTANSTAVPIGVPVGHLPVLPCWIAFGQPFASPPGWVASAQSIAAPVTCNNPFHGEAGTSATTNGSPKFGQSACGGNHGGSREQAYAPTATVSEAPAFGSVCMLNSISAMPIYLNKSPEEIRWEDYRSGDKGGPEPGIGSFQTAPSPFSASSTPSNSFASQKPAFTLPKFGVPTTPIFGSSVFAPPYSACPFGQSFATPFSSTSANLFASQTPVLNSTDLVSPTSSFICPPLFGMQSGKPFSSSISTNSFAPSQLPCFPSAAFGASITGPLASSVSSAPFSPSPFGPSVNPFSSSTPHYMFPPKSSSFGSSSIGASSAYPFASTPSSALCGFGTESGSGFVANVSAPSFGPSSSPSVYSSSFTFGPSSRPVFKAPSTPVSTSYGSPLCGGPVPSIFSQFGSVGPNSVLPSAVSGETNFSFAPSIVLSFGGLNIPGTASTGNGSEGNLWSTCPTSTAGFDTTASSATTAFQPLQTSESEGVPIGNIDWSAAGDGSIAWNAFSPPVASKWGF